jgi:lipopolysaccharide transport system permease protein
MSQKEINNRPYTLVAYIKRLKAYGFLLRSLANRELKVKYSRAVLGVGWMIIQPLVAVVIYSIFFNYLIKIDTKNIPYIQFVFSGLVIWYIFTGIVSKGSVALLESTELISKVSFPRLIIIVAKSFPVLIESLILFLVLIVMILINQIPLGLNILIALFFILEAVLFSLSVAILLSILIVRFRDFLHILPFIMNFGIWLTPVFYPVSIIPAQFQIYIKYLNPLATSVEGLRGALFEGAGVSVGAILVFVASLFLLFISLVFFIKFEKQIVERL